MQSPSGAQGAGMSQRASGTAYSFFVFYAIMQMQFIFYSAHFLKTRFGTAPPAVGEVILVDKK
jgi:hypothetical protein